MLQALVQTGFQQYRALVNAAMDTPGSFEDRVKVLARSVFQSASTQTAVLAFHPQRHLGAARYGAAADGKLHASSTTASSACWPRRPRKRSPVERLRRGRLSARMLILMGAISEAATGFVIAGKPELTPELADEIVETIFNGWTDD